MGESPRRVRRAAEDYVNARSACSAMISGRTRADDAGCEDSYSAMISGRASAGNAGCEDPYSA